MDEGKPFYLNLAHYAVHSPFETDERFINHYPQGEKNDKARAFATLIEGMDKSLGDLMNKLDEMGIAENTFIIFLGDNGGDAPLGDAADYGSSAPLKGKKDRNTKEVSEFPLLQPGPNPIRPTSFRNSFQ